MDVQPTPNAAQLIAARLNPAQRRTIRDLDSEFVMLGCSEATARRLTFATTRRPALVAKRSGPHGSSFALNDVGAAVKEMLR